MFVFCVVITVSLTGLIWFRSLETKLFVLMNPDPKKQAEFFALRDEHTPALLANLQNSYGVLRGAVSTVFSLKDEIANTAKTADIKSNQKTYLLPLPGNK